MATSGRRVVIIGGGFGGLYATRALRGADVEITLLDRKNHHTFQPLLYQVATAGLNPADIAVPIRRIFRHQRNASVLLADVTAIDVEGRCVRFSDGDSIPYDHLIVAVGATHSYFGHDDWEKVAPGLKTIEDALEIRKRIFYAFEAAERESDPARFQEWLTFVLVGGGPTGVELAGTLAEIAKKTLAEDFRRIDPTKARIILVEGASTLLGAYVPELRQEAKEQLERLGVEVRLDARVTSVDDGGVMLGEERINARTVLWAAGVSASPLVKSLGAPLDRAGRVLVEPDLSIPGHPEVAVVGDCAAAKMPKDGFVPGVARAAIEGGRHAALNIERRIAGEPPLPFDYEDPGMLATIGRGAAIADFGRIKLEGFLAWMAWLFIHILFLIGFKNRFAVIMEWAIAYLTYDRGARLITGKLPGSPPPPSIRPARQAAPSSRPQVDQPHA
jgi:NADH dehydrogenase